MTLKTDLQVVSYLSSSFGFGNWVYICADFYEPRGFY